MNAPTPPTRKVAKPKTKRPRKPLAAQPAPETIAADVTPPVAEPEAPKDAGASAAAVEEPTPPAPEAKAEPVAPAPEVPPPETPASAPEVSVPQEPQRQERQEHREERRGDRREGREGRRDDRRENRGRDERRGERRPEPQRQERREEPRREPQEVGPQTRGLTLLGAKTTVYSDRYTPAVLEAFENRHPENDYFVKFNCPEFTSLCPITGQPDFATLYISYIPDRKMVESKSLKLYLFGFRNHGAFHEDCVNTIMKDLIKLMSPRYIEVWGRFLPRGGLSIDPYANYGRPTTRWEEFARQRLLMHDLTPERVDNR